MRLTFFMERFEDLKDLGQVPWNKRHGKKVYGKITKPWELLTTNSRQICKSCKLNPRFRLSIFWRFAFHGVCCFKRMRRGYVFYGCKVFHRRSFLKRCIFAKKRFFMESMDLGLSEVLTLSFHC